jgi:hypothetical protein
MTGHEVDAALRTQSLFPWSTVFSQSEKEISEFGMSALDSAQAGPAD